MLAVRRIAHGVAAGGGIVIIGVLSDTHGDMAATLAGVRLLRDKGAEYLIHCGDVCGEHILDALAGIPSCFVFGNNDYDHDVLQAYANALGVNCLGVSGGIELDGIGIGVTHGDRPREVSRLCAFDSPYQYVFTGHSHRAHDKQVNNVRWLNPGALYRATTKTVMTLDLGADLAEWHEVRGI